MARLLLLGIVCVAVIGIAPFTARSGITPDQNPSMDTKKWDELDEALEGETQEVVEHRDERREDGTVERRRDRGREFVENVEED